MSGESLNCRGAAWSTEKGTILGNNCFAPLTPLSQILITWVSTGVEQYLWTTCDAGCRPVSRYRDIARSSDRKACVRKAMNVIARVSPPQSLLVTTAPAVLFHKRLVDKSTPKRCIHRPRVVHSWLQDQGRTRWPLDWAPFRPTGLIISGAVEKCDGPRRFTW